MHDTQGSCARGYGATLLLRMLMVIVLLPLSTGCSVKLVYNNLDRLARWNVSDYVDMNDAQLACFDAQVAQLLYWHRTEQLPEYATLLDTLAVTLPDGTSIEEIRGIGDRMYLWYDALETRLTPIASSLLWSLDAEQVAALPKKLIRDNAELAEDEDGLSLVKQQQRWLREYQDGISRFIGKLNKPQQDYLATQAVNYIPQYVLWADYRKRWQAAIMQLLLEGRANPTEFAQSFRQLVAARIPVYYGEELTAVFAHNERQYQEVTVWLFNNLTAKQQEKLQATLIELAAVFRELRAEAAPAPPAESAGLVDCAILLNGLSFHPAAARPADRLRSQASAETVP